MNWLAHAFLSPPVDRVCLGNLLADAIAPRDLAALPAEYRHGVKIHRAIDGAVHAHPAALAARRILRSTPYRLTGIVTDVVWDHFLIRHWTAFTNEPFDAFIRRIYGYAPRLAGEVAGDPPLLMRAIVENDFLRSYETLEGVRASLTRLGRRIERRWNRPVPLGEAVPEVQANDEALDACFLALFPDMIAAAHRSR